MPKIVALVGSPSTRSRTRHLVQDITQRVAQRSSATTSIVDIAELLPDLAVRSRADAAHSVQSALYSIEQADLLIVGSPVYKGSYTGLFKHFIDLLDYKALAGVPVALLATGGTDRHALVIDHQLRPLFGFFNAHTLPTGVFVAESAYADGRLSDPALLDRLSTLVDEAVTALSHRTRRENRHAA